MGKKIDEVLGSMTATELAALEGELDKRAGELTVEHYYGLGVKLAQDEVAAWKQSGELTPLLRLVKSAAEDEKKEKGEEKKDEKSEKKLPPWLQKGEGKKEDKEEKGEEKEEKDEEKKEDEKESSLDELLEKASAEDLVEFEAKLDEQILVQKYAAFYGDCGRKLAREVAAAMQKEAVKIRVKAPKVPSAPKPNFLQDAGTAISGFAKKHPMAAGAIGGAGGLFLGQKVLGSDRR